MEKRNHNNPDRLSARANFAVLGGLGTISGVVYLFNFKLYRLFPQFLTRTGIHFYVCLFLFLSVLYLLAVFLILKREAKIGNSWRLIGLILFFAVIFRFFLIPSDPVVLSKDMYRYIWDGRVQQSGINPYFYPPAADELKTLRDDLIFPKLNRKEYPTLYPAGAQMFFRICYLMVGNSVFGFKSISVFFDILTLLVLTALLKAYGFNMERLIIYAWNPLVIFEIAYSGHLEGITVFLMVTAFYLNSIKRKMPGIIVLALSSAIKLYPALLLAAFLNRVDRIKGILTFSATFVLLYLPYVTAGRKIFGFLPTYLNKPSESFNLVVKYLLMGLFPELDYYLLSLLFVVALLAAALVVFFREKHNVQVVRSAYIMVGLLIIFMPAALHPWYVILIVPFLSFFPSVAWLMFSITVTLSYLKYVSPQGIMPIWVLVVEYLPLFAFLGTGYIIKKAVPDPNFSRA
jgi:hypothetical protein